MRPYEVMIILDASLEDDVIQATVERATKLIAERGGTANGVERWGRRKFAYELDHKLEGYYALLSATAEPAVMSELDRMLTLADEVVRHKVIHLPKQALGTTRGRRPEAAAGAPVEAGAPAEDAIGA
jgi:small subunit ribosomal protein S6